MTNKPLKFPETLNVNNIRISNFGKYFRKLIF